MLAGRNRWHYSTEWNLRFIQNVASCYVLCLTKVSVITATLVHAPRVCVCVCVCHAHRTEVWVICVRLKFEVEAGPDWIPSRSVSGWPETGVRTLRNPEVNNTHIYVKKLYLCPISISHFLYCSVEQLGLDNKILTFFFFRWHLMFWNGIKKKKIREAIIWDNSRLCSIMYRKKSS